MLCSLFIRAANDKILKHLKNHNIDNQIIICKYRIFEISMEKNVQTFL